MKIWREHVVSVALLVAAFAVSAALYSYLPDPVPTHWNTRGEADGFMAKPLGAFILPIAMIWIHVVLLVVPYLSPRGYEMATFQRSYTIIRQAILGFMLLVTIVSHLAAMGTPLPLSGIVSAGLGLLFVVLGNFMGKVRKNFFLGIRTPWTLTSDEVWLRTHRLAGKLFVLAGLAVIVSALLGGGTAGVLVCVGLASLIPVAYSYVIYQRIEGPRNGG